jgi:uncharacterized protein
MLQPFPTPIVTDRRCIRGTLVLLFAVASLAVSTHTMAQTEAPGQPVAIPGVEISGWGKVEEVQGRFGLPAGALGKVPVVLVLHGSGGVDGRGAPYAKALQDAGIATLEITMFQAGGRPQAGHQATMPHEAAAFKWLAAQPGIDAKRLGVMGYSWGGMDSVLLSSDLVRERLGKEIPRPIALAALYPVCSNLAAYLANRENAFYNAQTRMSTTPVFIQVGTHDDYESDERACDALVETWPASARQYVTVRYLEGVTHGFDLQKPREFPDPLSHGGRGGIVRVVPNPEAAAVARQAIVSFFVRHLNP